LPIGILRVARNNSVDVLIVRIIVVLSVRVL
jgi:hypothetical protein